MTLEEKQLLIQDICSRLPYKPILINKDLNGGYPKKCFPGYIGFGRYIDSSNIEDTKIYLRPLNSMTEEEKEYVEELSTFKCTPDKATQKIDFYVSHHIDYRALIEKGLALEAKEDMYK